METIVVPTIENPDGNESFFSEETYSLNDFNGMWISDRQDAQNFRHRVSRPEYKSDWHVAGDPTLIIIRQGCLRISLRDQSFRDFKAGDQFIAKDRLLPNITFDPAVHGHSAEVIGNITLHAVHIKLGFLAEA